MFTSLTSSIAFRTISTRSILKSEDRNLYEEAYCLWKKVFSDTFKNVIGPGHVLFSDEFLLQDEVGILVFNGVVAGIITFLQLDTTSPVEMDRGYFRNYPSQSLAEIKARFKNVFCISNLAIAPEFRRSNTNRDFSALLIGLGVLRFLNSNQDALITITRNDRRTNEKVLMFGGQVIARHRVHGLDSDLISIEREDGINAISRIDEPMFKTLTSLTFQNSNIIKQATANKENA